MKVFLVPSLFGILILSSSYKSGLVSSLAIPHLQKPMGIPTTTTNKVRTQMAFSETLSDLSQSGLDINGGSLIPSVMESEDPVLADIASRFTLFKVIKRMANRPMSVSQNKQLTHLRGQTFVPLFVPSNYMSFMNK